MALFLYVRPSTINSGPRCCIQILQLLLVWSASKAGKQGKCNTGLPSVVSGPQTGEEGLPRALARTLLFTGDNCIKGGTGEGRAEAVDSSPLTATSRLSATSWLWDSLTVRLFSVWTKWPQEEQKYWKQKHPDLQKGYSQMWTGFRLNFSP